LIETGLAEGDIRVASTPCVDGCTRVQGDYSTSQQICKLQIANLPLQVGDQRVGEATKRQDVGCGRMAVERVPVPLIVLFQ